MGLATAIGLGVAGVGSFLSSKSQSKAAGKAADASVAATRENAELFRETYGQNKATLDPYINRGNAAGNQINALLGLGGPQPMPAGTPAAPQIRPSLPSTATRLDNLGPGIRMPGADPFYREQVPKRNALTVANEPQMAGNGQTAQQAAENAFDIFRNSTGYQFRVDQANDAFSGDTAASGWLQSGAALKARDEMNQNLASNEFAKYMGYLGNQQGVGLSGGSALAGVSQNFASNMAVNNNNSASAIGNAALAKGQNNPFANALGMIGGGLFQYGMG